MSTTASIGRLATPSRTGSMAGTWTLAAFALRRDRIWVPAWVLGLVASVLVMALSLPATYKDAPERQARADLMSNPAAIAMGGPEIGVDNYTFGAMMTNELLGFVAIFVALMNVLLVVRHTRAEEEAGRTELIRSGVTGRAAPLASTVLVAFGVNCALLVLTAAGLWSLRIESVDLAGSLLFASALAMVGLVFAGVAAVTSQVAERARTATALALLMLGVSYLLRAVGDIGSGVLSWLSPIGWAQRTYAYVDNRWWPLLIGVIVAGVLVAVAFRLVERRDVGAGMWAARPGPSRASARLAGPIALAIRLQRGSIAGWTLAMLAFGLMYGSLLDDVERFASELSAVDEMLSAIGGAFVDAFLAMIVSLLAMIATAYSLLAILRVRAEERAARADLVLATPVSRRRWLGSQVVVAIGGGFVVLLGAAIGLGTVGALVLDDAGVLPDVLAAAIVSVVPLAVTVALATFLIGWLPRFSQAGWLVLAYGVVVGLYGPLLGFPGWMADLSPFAAIPMLPAESFAAGPVAALTAVAALLLAAGFAGFQRRDIGP